MKDRISRATTSLTVFLATFATLVLVSPFAAQRACGQFAVPTKPTQTEVYNIFQSAPSELRRPLSLARKALEEQQYAEAAGLLGRLLMEEDAEDYFIGASGVEGTQTSLKAEAQRLIGSMPKQGRDRYEEIFGAEARNDLKEALQAGDARKLTEVSRKFFHTTAGYEATMLLGRLQLDQGKPLAAALSFKRVHAAGRGNQFEPELSLMLATCWVHANMPREAEKTLVDLKQRQPRASLRIGAEEVRLFDDPKEALPWITKLIGAGKLQGGARQEQWVMFRGNASRNGSTSGSLPLLSPRWKLPPVNDPSDLKHLTELSRTYRDGKVAALPGIHPLAVGDTLLYRTPHLLLGVDLQTGKRIWQYPWSSSFDTEQAAKGLPSPRAGQGSSPRREYLKQRLWNDAPYGQISSNGDSIFMIEALDSMSSNRQGTMVFRGGLIRQNAYARKSYNELVCLSIQNEGSLLWKVGGVNGHDEEKLAGAFFLGAPLPLQGSLYTLVEINTEIRLVVLDAKTGHQQWSQQLASVESTSILQDTTRRLAGATPSFDDGVLICPTSKGAVVAVDLSTRSLLWGYQYGQVGIPTYRRFGHIPSAPFRNQGDRWNDATCTIADGRVLLTPVESDHLHCLDLLTGKSIWSQPIARGSNLYLACVHKNEAILVGKNTISALNLNDGHAAWSITIPDGEMPSGRGYYSDQHYYLPTSNSELLKINLEEGKIAKRVQTDGVLGNLVCHKDQIVSVNTDQIVSYFQSEPLRLLVTERLKKNPDDAWALAHQGELLLHDGKKTEALVALRRAQQLDPDNDAARTLLVQTLLGALREDFAASQQIAAELENLIELPSQRAEYLRLMALGLKEMGKTEQAFFAFLEYSGYVGVEQQTSTAATDALESIDRYLRVRRDHWVRGQLAGMMTQAEGPLRKKMDQAINERLQAAIKQGTPQALQQFVNYFGGHPQANQVRLALADKKTDAGDLLAAELMLTPLTTSADRKLAASSMARLARLLEKAERYDRAAACYQLLADKWGDVVCLDGKTGKQLLESLPPDSATRRAFQGTKPWLDGKTKVQEINASTAYMQNAYPILVDSGRRPFATEIAVNIDTRLNQVVISDLLGNDLARVPLNRRDNRRMNSNEARIATAQTSGNLLVLNLGYEVLAIDMLAAKRNPKDAILWRIDLIAPQAASPGRPPQPQTVRLQSLGTPFGESIYYGTDTYGRRVGQVGPLSEHGVCYLMNGELTCLDPQSGEPLWVRSGFDAGSELFGDQEYLFVTPNNSNQTTVISAIDGREIGKRQLSPSHQRWMTVGSRALGWMQQGNQFKLTLRDILTEKDLWSRSYPIGARGVRVGTDEVAILQTDGTFHILSLSDAELKIDAKVEKESTLSSIYVLRNSDQYLLATNRPITYNPSTNNVQSAPSTIFSPMVYGKLYAFDRENGELLWGSAEIDRYGLPLAQPVDLPVLFFLRNVMRTNPQTRRRSMQASVLCIDRRDGRLIFEREELTTAASYYTLVGNRENQTVTLSIPGRRFVVTLTADPTPPAPPAQSGAASNEQASATGTTPGQAGNDDPFDPFAGRRRVIAPGQRAIPVPRAVQPQIIPQRAIPRPQVVPRPAPPQPKR